MTARPTFDKSAMPSRRVTEGTFAAPQRAFYYAMGLEADDIHRPLVGVVAAWDGGSAASEVPLEVAEMAESGVTAGGATPRRFATMAVGAPGSLITRELVADTVELTVRGHSYDALVGVAATAPAIAGLMMVACRLDVPAVVVPLASPTLGSSPGAYAMAAAAAAIGLAETGTGDAPGRVGIAETGLRAGARVTERLRDGRTARKLVTAEALHRAARALAAADGGPPLVVHLAALAVEAGVALDLEQLTATMAQVRPDLGWVRGSLAPDGALVAGPGRAVRATARVFDDPADAGAWLARSGWPAGTAVIVRFQGPRGGPGMVDLEALVEQATRTDLPDDALLITDGWAGDRAALTTVSAAGPEAAVGGPLSQLRDGDAIELDVAAGWLDAPGARPDRPAAVLAPRVLPRTWQKYARTVGTARDGAPTHPGVAGEVVRYGDL